MRTPPTSRLCFVVENDPSWVEWNWGEVSSAEAVKWKCVSFFFFFAFHSAVLMADCQELQCKQASDTKRKERRYFCDTCLLSDKIWRSSFSEHINCTHKCVGRSCHNDASWQHNGYTMDVLPTASRYHRRFKTKPDCSFNCTPARHNGNRLYFHLSPAANPRMVMWINKMSAEPSSLSVPEWKCQFWAKCFYLSIGARAAQSLRTAPPRQ